MKQKYSKWIKLGSRNLYTLSLSAVGHTCVEGTTLGKIRSRFPNYLMIRYGTPLMTDFQIKDGYKSNFLKILAKNPKEFEHSIRTAEKLVAKYLKVNPGKSRQDVKRRYDDFKRGMGLMYAGYFFTHFVLQKLKELTGEKLFEKIHKQAAHPYELPTLLREHNAIESSRKKFHQGRVHGRVLDSQLRALARTFGYLHSEYAGTAWDADDYHVEIQRPFKKRSEKKPPKLPDLSPEIRRLVKIAQHTTYIFDEGKTAAVRTMWALRETVKNLKLPEQTIMGFTEEEFLRWTKTGALPRGNIAARAKYYSVFIQHGKLKEIFGKEAVGTIIKRERITEYRPVTLHGDVIRGQVGFPGTVVGKVRVVLLQKDADLLKKEEILVASMTTPEFIRGMRNAAAFVTDEGGLLCHAAIIAREMKKPCVIGANIATKVLRTGDRVKVDANRGVVKILKKA